MSLGATAERDPRRRDAMRERLGETVGKSESKRREVRERFKWLDAKHVVDDKGRDPSHAEYDANTVRVPSDLKLSASQKQYWDVKSKFRDVVLFFKVGKFYELYEDDAEIGCAALDWKMTVSGVGHCRQVGCPESGVDAATAELVRRGLPRGRVEQMETAAEAKARTGSKTAVIRRELAGVITPVTVVDGDLAGAGKIAPDATHVLAFVEESGEESGRIRGIEPPPARDGRIRLLRRRRGSAPRGFLRRRRLPRESRDAPVAHGAGGGCDAPRRRQRRRARRSGEDALRAAVVALAPRTEFPEDGAAADDALDALAVAWDGGASRDERADETNDRYTGSGRSGRVERVSALRSSAVRDAHPAARAATAALATHLDRLRCASALAAAEATAHAVYAEERVRLDGPTLRDLELLVTAEGRAEEASSRASTRAAPRRDRGPFGAGSPRRFEIRGVAERQDAVAALGGTSGGEDAAEAEERRGDCDARFDARRTSNDASDARARRPRRPHRTRARSRRTSPRRDTRAGSPRSQRRLSRRETRWRRYGISARAALTRPR